VSSSPRDFKLKELPSEDRSFIEMLAAGRISDGRTVRAPERPRSTSDLTAASEPAQASATAPVSVATGDASVVGGAAHASTHSQTLAQNIRELVAQLVPQDAENRLVRIEETSERLTSLFLSAVPLKRTQPDYLKRALEGLSPSTQAEVERVMLNTDMRPDDPGNILLVLFGYIVEAGERIPDSIKFGMNEVHQIMDRLNVLIGDMPEKATVTYNQLLAKIEQRSVELADVMIKTQHAQTVTSVREMLWTAASDVMREYQKKLQAEQSPLLSRLRLVTTVTMLAVFAVGSVAGYGFAVLRPPLTTIERLELGYGEKLIQMWNDPGVSSTVRQQIASWLRTH
jgi:nitrate reductase NapE component